MWSDNETTVDLLGFKVHSDLILKVVSSPTILPVVIGVFGDWGGGKSSIMKMLQTSLESNEKTLCLYFNGWTFEDYEDAKTALISSILVGIGEHKKFHHVIKDDVVSLLKRVKWMQLAKLGIKHIGVPLAISAITGGVGAIPAAITSLIPTQPKENDKTKDEKDEKHDKEDSDNWLDLIESSKSKPDILEVRKFREDFEIMLKKTNLNSLVVLIDDLDRCLPERIIDTLEAIKLFVSVPKTAFVVGADPRIVKHAIATRYVSQQINKSEVDEDEHYDLVDDYLEKLIQVPYHLPRLSPTEIETYINLLICQKYLDGTIFNKTLDYWQQQRQDNFYSACGYDHIKASLEDPQKLTAEIESQLLWSSSIAKAITDGLKGNPRQVKRMLNSLILRKDLAQIAKLQIKDDVLAKLMVLEYISLPLFKELNNWQTAERGFPSKLKELESYIKDDKEIPADILGNWNKPFVKTWLQIPPYLSEVDLRDYFWLARDKTDSMLVGAQMVPPLIRRLFNQLVNEGEGEQYIALNEIKKLNGPDLDFLLQVLSQQIEHAPDTDKGLSALIFLQENNVAHSTDTLLQLLESIPAIKIPPKLAFELQTLSKNKPEYNTKVENILIEASKTNSPFGKAANKIINR